MHLAIKKGFIFYYIKDVCLCVCKYVLSWCGYYDLFILCVCVFKLPVYMYMYYVSVCCLWRSKEGITSPRTRVTDGYKPPCGPWGHVLNHWNSLPIPAVLFLTVFFLTKHLNFRNIVSENLNMFYQIEELVQILCKFIRFLFII